MTQSTPRHVHLVGSAAFETTEQTFDMFGEHLSACADRFPDGETGDRKNWVLWQDRVLRNHPQFELVQERVDPRNPDVVVPSYALRDGVADHEIAFKPLGYAEVAQASFEIFSGKVDAGVLPADSRFLVSLPTPLAFTWVFVPDQGDQARIEKPYEAALLREVDIVAAALPHDRIAIQWDVASEMTSLERGSFVDEKTGHAETAAREFGDMFEDFSSRLIRLSNHVPGDIELAIHLCYGDFGHRHSIEPSSLRHCVDMANRLVAGATRPIELIHMPVPRDRDDDDYFAPLADLDLPPETTLSLGLVHHTDGLDGTRRRMATARKFVEDFGIATECGMGRRKPGIMAELLEIHARAAAADAG